MEISAAKDDKDKKSSKPRCRMKKMLNNVQETLEFYFSDVNLNHDRFLRKEIESSADGYIELSTMLKFNKLKLLTSDNSVLAKAVGNSSLLELNEKKDKVRRKEKLKGLENTDMKTVYVEEFPLQIDHDWLKSVFSTCGKVEYVSLPKFKHNNQLKGFAFIEFSTADEAQKACQALNTIRFRNKKRLSTDDEESIKKKGNRKRRSTSECDATCIPPSTGRRRRSISESSNGSSCKVTRKKRRNSHSASEDPAEYKEKIERELLLASPEKVKDKSGNTTENTRISESDVIPETTKNSSPNKRKRKTSEIKELESEKKKVTKEPSTPETVKDSVIPKIEISPAPDSENESKDCKRKISTSSDIEEFTSPLKKVKVENDEEEKGKDVKKKKNRQHKKKEKKGEKMSEPMNIPPLHVIPKNEWLSLKKEYKRLQRIKMSELKRNLKVLKSEQVRRTELKERISETIAAKTGGTENQEEERKSSMDEEKENYLESTAEGVEEKKVETTTATVAETKSKGLVMVPGTVVGLKTSSENLTRKDIKGALVSFGNVVYVDYVDGVYQGFVRFATASDAENVLSANSTDQQSWPFQLRKLTVDEENDYFNKAEEDRLKKYNKDQRKKRKKERGADKIANDVEAVSSHIHFT